MFRKKQSGRQQTTSLRERAANRPRFSYYSSAKRSRTDGDGYDAGTDAITKRLRLRLLPSALAIAAIAGSILFSLTLSPHVIVKSLNDEPSPYRPLDEYALATNKIIASNLSSMTKLTIDTHEVEAKLLEQYPELKAAVVRLPVLGRRPNVVVDIESPALLITTPTKSYVLDEAGLAVSEVAALSTESRAGLLVVQDQSGLKLEVGKHALPSQTVRFITEVAAYLKAQNLAVSQLTMPTSANQLDIHIEGLPYYVKTDVAGDAQLQIGSFLAVKGKLEKDRAVPSEYVDVRVEEKVFYK